MESFVANNNNNNNKLFKNSTMEHYSFLNCNPQLSILSHWPFCSTSFPEYLSPNYPLTSM